MNESNLFALATEQLTALLRDPKLSKNQRLRGLEIAAKLLSLQGNGAPRIEGDEATELLRGLGLSGGGVDKKKGAISRPSQSIRLKMVIPF